MGKPTSYAPGEVAWVDLRTTDLADAKRFYAALFNWTYQDMAGDGSYIAAFVEGDAVAGLKPLAAGQRAGGSSPFWLTYVTVADADVAATRTRELGGTVHAEPFDIGAERMTVIDDPAGARLCLRQSPDGIGACRIDDAGCLTWNELSTSNVAASTRFYAGLFDWHIELGKGVREVTGPARWTPHFAVARLEETLARGSAAGGRLLSGPREARDGRSAILCDPQQAEFGIVEQHR